MNVHDAALAWWDAGACVLPAAADGSKRPAGQWDRYKTERPSRTELDDWVTTADGIGLVCGTVSGNIEMFEAEAAAYDAGMVDQLLAMLPPTLVAKLNTYFEISPKGGVHWIFRVDSVPVKGNTKLARMPVTKTVEAPNGVQVLFETRGEGGWTIAAPSGGRTHPSGKPWKIVAGSPGVIPMLTADEYRLLHACAATFDTMPEQQPPPSAPRPDSTDHTGAPGDDFNTKATWDEILIPAGWTRVRQRGDVVEWVRPGKKPRDGISATTGYMGDWFFPFTTSTEFESERTHSKFKTYAVLHHGGDVSAAARDLRQRGYGAQRETPPRRLKSVPEEGFVTGETTEPPPPPPPGSEQPQQEPSPPSWEEIDLTAYLDGSFKAQEPELFRRADGHYLLYRSRVHSFHGESESGKSWAALHVGAEAMAAGEQVAMIDFESDPKTVVDRLLLLGVPADTIRAQFHYRRPEVSPKDLTREREAWDKMLGQQYAVVIIDGVTEALSVFSVTSKDNDEVTKWIRTTPRRIATSTGAAVVLVDHVTKDADTRGRFAIGGQAKMAALDGAAYVVEVLDPLGIGLVGRISLRVAKDRPGRIRPISGSYRKTDRTQETCVLVVDSSAEGQVTIRVDKPRTETQDVPEGERQPWRPTVYMESVSRALERANAAMSRTGLKTTVSGNNDRIWEAINFLIEDGYVAEDGPSLNGGRPSVRLIKPFRKDGGPVPDLENVELVPDPPSRPVPRPRFTNRGTGGTGRKDVGPVPRDGSGTGPGRVEDPDLPDPEEDPDE